MLARYGQNWSSLTSYEARYVTESFSKLDASREKFLADFVTLKPISEVFPLYTNDVYEQLRPLLDNHAFGLRRLEELGIDSGTAEARKWLDRCYGLGWYTAFIRSYTPDSRVDDDLVKELLDQYATYARQACLWTWKDVPEIKLMIESLAPLFPRGWDKTPRTHEEVHECSEPIPMESLYRGLVYVAYATGMAPWIREGPYKDWISIEAMAEYLKETPGKVAQSVLEHARYFFLARCPVKKTVVIAGTGAEWQYASKVHLSCRYTEWRDMLRPYLEAEGLQFHDEALHQYLQVAHHGAHKDLGYESSEICQALGDHDEWFTPKEYRHFICQRVYKTKMVTDKDVIRHITSAMYSRRFVVIRSPHDGRVRFNQAKFTTAEHPPHAIEYDLWAGYLESEGPIPPVKGLTPPMPIPPPRVWPEVLLPAKSKKKPDVTMENMHDGAPRDDGGWQALHCAFPELLSGWIMPSHAAKLLGRGMTTVAVLDDILRYPRRYAVKIERGRVLFNSIRCLDSPSEALSCLPYSEWRDAFSKNYEYK